MKVSICVPIYGVEKYIERCVRSLFEQTYPDIEYIFVDDSSPDKSVEVLMQVLEEYPQRKEHVHIIRQEKNRGLAAARNTAVDACQTEFLMHVDSDDWIEKSAIEKLLKEQSETDADIVCFDARVVFQNHIECYKNDDYSSPEDFVLKMLSGKVPHQLWGHLIRRSLYVTNRITALEGVNQAEDYQVMPRLAYYATKVSTLHETLYYYDRTTENSYSSNFKIDYALQIDKANQIIEDFFSDKETVYRDVIQKMKLLDTLKMMKNVSVLAEDNGYYDVLLSRLGQINILCYKDMRFDYKVIHMLRLKILVKLFCNLLSLYKKTIVYLKLVFNKN